MQQWEYKVETISVMSCSESLLNWYGKEGWELVGIYRDAKSSYAVFKRPKEG